MCLRYKYIYAVTYTLRCSIKNKADKEENTRREKLFLGVLLAELWACLTAECLCLHEASCLILLAQLQPLLLIYTHSASGPASQKLIFREKVPERS